MEFLLMPRFARWRKPIGWLAVVPLALFSLWAVVALALDLPSLPWKILALACYGVFAAWLGFGGAKRGVKLIAWFLVHATVLSWWLSLRPPTESDWQVDVSRLPWAEQDGNRVVVHEVRNFSYRTEQDYDPRWETRTVDLTQLQGADVFLTHWGAPLVAHSMVSFFFRDGSTLATSIEARKTKTQEYSTIRGFFRQYPVIYLMADERDVVRLRTNYRQHENVYLYRTRLTPEDARRLFEAYLGWMNRARAEPQWYNAVTKNCGSPPIAFLAREKIGGITRTDLRGLLAGSGDKMLYELGDLAGDALPFEQLKRQAFINTEAQKADAARDFSALIRLGRAGFGPQLVTPPTK